MRPLPRSHAALVVVGLGYGDEGKGSTVDFLAHALPDTAAVVRWSGGAQAAHNVIHGPRHHTFRQFGSASLLDVPTLLRAPTVIDPLALGVESEELGALGVGDPLGLVTADARCLVTTRIHAALNRAREEARGVQRHGSCGMGIGETVAYALAVAGRPTGNFAGLPAPAPGSVALRMVHLESRRSTRTALDALMRSAAPLIGGHDLPSVDEMTSELLEVAAHLRIDADIDRRLRTALDAGSVLFEGTQGVLLDEHAGFHPHTTWATLLPGGADAGELPDAAPAPGLADDAMTATGIARVGLRAELRAAGFDPFVLGLTRTYQTRHGAGPLPTEDAAQSFAEPHNGVTYQGMWRQGPLDLVTLRYAARTVGVDGVGVSHLDVPVRRVASAWQDAEPENVLTLHGAALQRARERNAARAGRARPVWADVDDADVLRRHIEEAAGAPVVLIADGPARVDRTLIDRRATAGAPAGKVLASAMR